MTGLRLKKRKKAQKDKCMVSRRQVFVMAVDEITSVRYFKYCPCSAAHRELSESVTTQKSEKRDFQYAMHVSNNKRHMEETFGKAMPIPRPNPFDSMRIINKFTMIIMCVQCKSL